MNDPSFLNYGQTILRFETDRDIDLRSDLDAADVDDIRALGIGDAFAIITAYNPHGGDIDEQDNERRQTQLLSEIAWLGVPYLRVAGRSPDGEHCEDSVAVAMPFIDARRLGARFGQTAIYWFDGDRFVLRGAAANFPDVQLPASEQDLAAAAARAELQTD